MIAAADDEHIRPDLTRPADIELRVGEGGGADGEADDVELALLPQLIFEFRLFVQIKQVEQLHMMPALLEHGGNRGQTLAVIAARNFPFHVAVSIVGVDEQHTRFASVKIYHNVYP